jgi:hypothetical protein
MMDEEETILAGKVCKVEENSGAEEDESKNGSESREEGLP